MPLIRCLSLVVCLLLPAALGCQFVGSTEKADVIVYGGTPSGITAAIAARTQGTSVILLEPTQHVGGMSTSGLNRDEAEHMDRATFGGLADTFFTAAALRSGQRPNAKAKVWHSRVAEEVFLEMLDQAGVVVHYGQAVESTTKQGTQIISLCSTEGTTYEGRVFIDASYEGDLLARAGVGYVTGRESRDAFDESLAGVVYPDEAIDVSPFDDNGGLLFGVMPGKPPKPGGSSPHPTPYNIRLNLTIRQDDNFVEITKPTHYDPAQHELLARAIQAGVFETVGKIIGRYVMPGGKVETNNRQFSIISTSIPGAQTPWSEASYEEREQIHRAYRDYTHGMLWFLKTDPRVPQAMRDDIARYGFCKDEWADNDHWPWQLYVREARRMRGSYVLTQHDITTDRAKDDAIHLGSHFIDSHQPTRYATADGGFINEGRLWQEGKVYQLPYRVITPKQDECTNLLVPVCVSATHVAFCSMRVEASWMMLGEAAGIAAALSLHDNRPVQAIEIKALQMRLRAAGFPLDLD